MRSQTIREERFEISRDRIKDLRKCMRSQTVREERFEKTVREERFENALKIFENICVLKPFVRNGLRTL